MDIYLKIQSDGTRVTAGRTFALCVTDPDSILRFSYGTPSTARSNF